MTLRFVRMCVAAVLLADQRGVAPAAQQANGDVSKSERGAVMYRGGLVAPPLPKPRFVLTDSSGAPFDFRQRTDGKVTLLFFGYTYCPDECPVHMANLGAALKGLPASVSDEVKLVFVSTDPKRDTPARLRGWLDNFDKRFVGLTGSEAAIEAAERAAGVPVAQKAELRGGNYGMAHANFVVAYTKDNLGHVVYPGGVSKDDWIHDLPLLVEARWTER
jgi:protein SCO1/2